MSKKQYFFSMTRICERNGNPYITLNVKPKFYPVTVHSILANFFTEQVPSILVNKISKWQEHKSKEGHIKQYVDICLLVRVINILVNQTKLL